MPDDEEVSLSKALLNLIQLSDAQGCDPSLLVQYLADFPVDDEPADEETNHQRSQLAALKDTLGRVILQSRQQLRAGRTPRPGSPRDESVQAIENEVVERQFTKQALERIPEELARFNRLKDLQAEVQPERRVNEYLSEAVDCYLLGLFCAAAVLCRSVLEFALKEAYQKKGLPVERSDLADLIDKGPATRILADDLVGVARVVKDVGNDAVHKRRCAASAALDVLHKTGLLLQRLYAQA